MKPYRKIYMGLLLGVFGLSWSASANTDYYTVGFFTRGADTGYYIDSGDPVYDPFYVPVQRLAVVPRFTVTASHEDNLFLDPDKSEESTIIRFIPGVAVIWGRPEQRHLYADYGASIPVYDSNNEIEDDISHLFTVGGRYLTAKSQAHGRVGYRRIENVDTVAGDRLLREDFIANLALEHRVSGKTSVGAQGSFERHDFDSDRYVDYDRVYGAGRVFYDITRRGQMFLQLGAGYDDLDSGSSGFGDADFYDVSVGLRGKMSPKTSASGRVGYMTRTYDDDRLDDVEHWVASLYAEANPFGFTTFSSELTADIRPAINRVGMATIDQRWTGGLTRRLFSERVRGNASLFFGRIDYEGPTDISVFEQDEVLVFDGRRDEYWGFTLGVDWWFKHNLSAGLSYSYIENKAARNAADDIQRAASYEAGRWLARVSWNY